MHERLAIILDATSPHTWKTLVKEMRARHPTPTPLLLVLDSTAEEALERRASFLANEFHCELHFTTRVIDTAAAQARSAERDAKAREKDRVRICKHLASLYRNAEENAPKTNTYRDLKNEALDLELDWDEIDETAQKYAESDRVLTQPIYDAAALYGPGHQTTKDLLEEVQQAYPSLRRYVESRRDAGAKNWLLRHGAEEHARTLTRVHPGKHSHRLDALPPARGYTVYIDETGTDFSTGDNERSEGKIVAIVVPDGVHLPPLEPSFHAVTESSGDVDQVLQTLLDSPVGILGISLRASGLAGAGDRWANCVFQMMLWVQRYIALPAPPTPVQLRFVIEERGAIRASSDLNLTISQLQNTLLEETPSRAKQLRPPEVEVVSKDNAFLPYADAVAYTWFAGNQASKERLSQSGLLYHCLHPTSLTLLENAYRIVTRALNPSPAEWRELLGKPEAVQYNSPLNLALIALSSRVQQAPSRWQAYLQETEAHLQSKAVEHDRLALELAWLDRAAPKDSPLSPRLRLVRRSAELAQANHSGHGRFPHEAELRALCDMLADEDPTLVCGAELRLAVMQTNRFAFHEASKELGRWTGEKLQHLALQHRGRVYSSIGRHHAYLGEFERADENFEIAITLFHKLSDPKLAAGEATHTGVYRALNAIDRPASSREAVQPFVEGLVGPIPGAINRLATSSEAADNYLHHLLLRFLASFGTPEEHTRYLALSPRWSRRRDGHPWGLIGLWRGILAQPYDADLCRVQLLEAYDLLTRNPNSTTLRFIGVSVGIATQNMLGEHARDHEELLRVLDEVSAELPKAAPRAQRLREALENPIDDPRALLAEVLPFQFK